MQHTYKKLLLALLLMAGVNQLTSAQEKEDSSVVIKQEKATVNIGFATQSPLLVTSAISTVKGADLQKTFNTNVANTLYGRLPGLTVTQVIMSRVLTVLL